MNLNGINIQNNSNIEDNDYFIYDIVSKHIIDYSEEVIRRTLEYMFKQPIIGEIENIPTEAFGKRADILVRVGSNSLFHIESESSYNSKKAIEILDRMIDYYKFFYLKHVKVEHIDFGICKNNSTIDQMVMYINNHPNLSNYIWFSDPYYKKNIKIFNVIDLKFKEVEKQGLYPLMVLYIANLRSQYTFATKKEEKIRIAQTIAKYYRRMNKVLNNMSLNNPKDALVLNKSLLMLKRSFNRLDSRLINTLNKEGLGVSREEELFMLEVQEQMKEEEKQEIKLEGKIEGEIKILYTRLNMNATEISQDLKIPLQKVEQTIKELNL
ncbi:hypothetical protein AN643_03705 [Candidatus Epulonipiscioides saccharophilum]|nr:hypothetical protein AN643_03705 [Epulopiscium sp. SCG-B10WGA-EpuloB]